MKFSVFFKGVSSMVFDLTDGEIKNIDKYKNVAHDLWLNGEFTQKDVAEMIADGNLG